MENSLWFEFSGVMEMEKGIVIIKPDPAFTILVPENFCPECIGGRHNPTMFYLLLSSVNLRRSSDTVL